MTTSRLQIYNDALLMLGERSLTSLTEDRSPRYLLDQVFDNDGIRACLEEGQWFFAMRSVQIDYDTDIDPSFGYLRAFLKPDDWVLTSALASDEFFKNPLTQYTDESGYWYSDLDTLYVRYVSDDDEYGMDMSLWPRSFAEFVAAHFASKILLNITNDERRLLLFYNPQNPLHSVRGRALALAKSRCAMAQGTKFPSMGSWTRARLRGGNRRDGGGTSGDLY